MSPFADVRGLSTARSALAWVLFVWSVAFLHSASAQEEEFPEEPPAEPPIVTPLDAPQPRQFWSGSATDFGGSLQIVRAPAGSPGSSKFGIEIFPEASRVFMSVRDTDPVPVERARRGGGWLCAKGGCTAQAGVAGISSEGDRMLRSIKIQTPAVPVPVTIWRRTKSGQGQLDFDPVLLGRRSYAHVCAYPPVESDGSNTPPKDPNKIELCKDGTPQPPSSDSADLMLGMHWPHRAELAGFRYLAVVDACGNALVQPFQQSFTVPVFEVASGGCGRPDGKVLRVFPTGGFLRVTAFNLDAPASQDVLNVTYRVSVPPLENFSESTPAKMLFPDLKLNDLRIDCGPGVRRGPTDQHGVPKAPPGKSGPSLGSQPVWSMPSAPEPPPKAEKAPPIPGDEPVLEDSPLQLLPDGEALPGGPAPQSTQSLAPPAGPPPVGPSPVAPPLGPAPNPTTPPGAFSVRGGTPPSASLTVQSGLAGAGAPVATDRGPASKPLDHGSLVIAPEPLAQGNCRLVLGGQTKWRLTAPLALRVSLYRTDITMGSEPISMLTEDQSTWIVTPNDSEFALPPLRESFDGDSRLKLVVQSDPLNPNGKMVLVGDAGRMAAVLHDDDAGASPELARRQVGSVTIHTVPLCGESNFETLEEAGSCVRAYLTVPAMLATLQITRFPWVEKPLITRSVLSAVGVALAFDSYDPVEREAFPIAGQLGGFVQNLGEDRIGLMAYAGVAPTLPVLGSGGNTTTFGFLAGVGMSYITNSDGPDEGFKPTAFISVVVQVGQANPEISSQASFGTLQ